MFGMLNKSLAFATPISAKLGNFTIDLTFDIVEEVRCNITNIDAAHAAMVPDKLSKLLNISNS